MRLGKKFELAWNMLVHSKLRSWLTIIGIVIGIAAVVAIVSISNGAQASMEERMNGFGADQITVTPGYTKASNMGGMMRGPGGGGGGGDSSSTSDDEDDPELTNRDILAVESVDNVESVAPKVSSNEEVIYSSKKSDVGITGLEYEDWETLVDDEIEEGRILTSSDLYSCVVGGSTSESFDGMQLNRQLTINGKTFSIVGILEGGRNIYVPMDSAPGVLEDVEEGVYDSLTVVAVDVDFLENTTDDIEDKLMMSRGILFEDDQDFTVSNQLAMQETISETLETMALFLGAIAAISLLVGGIGIANTMFTSVLEKTREIGIMKAIGAQNKDIMHIFLFNSGLIGLVGGVGGVVLGSVASVLIGSAGGVTGDSKGPMSMFSSTLITWDLLLFALVFSIVIGMIAGAVPAWNASRLKPVDALRYE